jgi:AcrR family transcriptional regulator
VTEDAATVTPAQPGRRVRADAQRNIDALIAAAKVVFAASGVDAPLTDIAAQAGVGVGTAYRHFSQRSDLVTAVFRQEVDACAQAAPALAAEYGPGEALTRWIDRYTGFIATKHGLAAALHSGDPAFAALPAYFLAHLGPALSTLLAAAAGAGEIRGDIAAEDLLLTVARICAPAGVLESGQAQRMVALLLDGLRYRAVT